MGNKKKGKKAKESVKQTKTTEDDSGKYGGLPDRDLKKNLGCG